MKNEELVLDHVPNAKAYARSFVAKYGGYDPRDAESIAVLAMVQASERYTGDPANGANFWGFVRVRVAGTLTDRLRSETSRGKRVMIPMPRRALRDPRSFRREIEARLTIQRAMETLPRRQHQAIRLWLVLEDPDSCAQQMGCARGTFDVHKRDALANMRRAIT
jgi:DNA-directed RNA polymerase specialized sigma24 family protein